MGDTAMDITVDMAMDTVMDTVLAMDMVMATTDTASGLLMLRLSLLLLPSPDTDMVDTVDMVAMDMDTVILDMAMEAMEVMVTMARGLLMLRLAMDMFMDMAMEVMDMDTVMDMAMDTAMDMVMDTDTMDKRTS